MTNYRSVAAKVALAKAAHPEKFCPEVRCLWRTGGGYCPRHRPGVDMSGLRDGEAYCVVCRERFVLTPRNVETGITRCQDCMVDGGAGRTRRHWTEQRAPYPMTAKGGNP